MVSAIRRTVANVGMRYRRRNLPITAPSVLDPTLIAAGAGLLASIVAGKAFVSALRYVPKRRRRAAQWLFICGAALVAIVGDLLSKGPLGDLIFAFLLATLPGFVAYLAFRTMLASAVVSLIPVYFFIGGMTPGRAVHMPAIAIDRAIPLVPAWMIVYGSLYTFMLLPVLVARHPPLFRKALQSYVFIMILAYAGFLLYPTLTPRPSKLVADSFAAWTLQLTYSLDTRYNCFPCLHVAHSLVSALTAFRVHRRVGWLAILWTALTGVSTLYTKQHYFVDVVAGALIAYLAYVIFLRGFAREAIPERDRMLAPRRALWLVAVYAVFTAGFWILYKAGVVVT
jgi:membrane-associated phospholipid phosphatase